MIIKIWGTDQGDGDEGGWMYSIWLDENADTEENPDGDDGGLCTGSKVDALEMAYDQGIVLLKMDCAHVTMKLDGSCDICGWVDPTLTIERDCMECERTFKDDGTHDVCHECRNFRMPIPPQKLAEETV